MRSWHASVLAALFGVCVGAGIGYAAALVAAAANTPLISAPAGDSFNQLFLGMGRLGTLEIVVANCRNRSDVPAVLRDEAELIPGIKAAAQAQGLNPPIFVAEAILAVRNDTEVPRIPDRPAPSQTEIQAQSALEDAGWGKESASRLRETVARLDENECGQASANGGKPQ
jgi:hypothetical protein